MSEAPFYLPGTPDAPTIPPSISGLPFNPLGGYNHYLFADFIVVSKFFSPSFFVVSIYCTQTS